MILHLLRLMWKAKKRNALLAFQLFVGFLLIFVMTTLSIHHLKKYNQPLGFKYEDRWYIQFYAKGDKEINRQIYNQLASMHEIAITSVGMGAPYFPSGGSSTRMSEITGLEVTNEDLHVDMAFKDVMELTMAEGSWFNESDPSKVIISPALKEALYGATEVPKSEVRGVLKNFRRLGEFDDETLSRIRLMNPEEALFFGSFIVKVPKGSGVAMEEQLVKTIRSVDPECWVKVTRLEDQRAEYLQKKLTPLLVIAGVGIFLFINVILGLFGVLWYSISQRVSEIGVRRAVGATASNISFQFVTEMLILASMGIIPGMIVAAQIQMLNLLKTDLGVYLLSMALTTILIYVLVSLCALIPVVKSSKMKPAEALAEE